MSVKEGSWIDEYEYIQSLLEAQSSRPIKIIRAIALQLNQFSTIIYTRHLPKSNVLKSRPQIPPEIHRQKLDGSIISNQAPDFYLLFDDIVLGLSSVALVMKHES